MNILEKYKPLSIYDVVGGRIHTQKMKIAVSLKKPVLILGPPGSGKTLILETYVKENGYNVLQISKDTIQQFTVFVKNETIQSFFDKRKKGVIIDNIDILMQGNEKNSFSIGHILDMCKLAISLDIDIFITCNSNEEKKITDIKKISEIIRISFPSPKDTFLYLMNIFDKESITYNSEKLLSLCTKYNGCIRECTEQFFCGNDKVNVVSCFRNASIFEVVQKLLEGDEINQYDIRYLIDDDATMKSFLLFENIPDEIHIHRCPKEIQSAISLYSKILEKYISSTILEYHMLQSYDWWFWDVIYMLRFLGAKETLGNIERVMATKNTQKNMRLSQLLSKTSHKQIFNKRLKSAYEGLSLENKLILADNEQKTKTEKERKNTLNSHECNFINTYSKYFC